MASLPDGSLSIEPWLALLRALLCRDGVDQMLADAQFAAETMAAGSFWRTASILYLATAQLMAGDPDRADVLFEDATAEGQTGGTAVGACVALGERSLLAIAKGAWGQAERHLAEARSLVREANLEDYPLVTILHAVAARIALHQSDWPGAGAELTRAQRLRPGSDLRSAAPGRAGQDRASQMPPRAVRHRRGADPAPGDRRDPRPAPRPRRFRRGRPRTCGRSFPAPGVRPPSEPPP